MSLPSPSALSTDGNIFVQPKAGALKKKAGTCKKCKLNFLSKQKFFDHLKVHVKLPSVILDRISWPIVLKINKDRLNQYDSEDPEGSLSNIYPRNTSVKQSAERPDDDDKLSDSADKVGSIKLTLKKSSSAGSPKFTVVHTPSPTFKGFPNSVDDYLEGVTAHMTENGEDVNENGIMSEEEEQMVDDNFSSNEENSDANRTMDSDPAMDQTGTEVNGTEEDEEDEETDLVMSAKDDDPEDVDKKLILKLTSKTEYVDIDEQGDIEQSESKDGSFCEEDEISFKNGIVKQSLEDMKDDRNSFEKEEVDLEKVQMFNHKDGLVSESEDETGKNAENNQASSPAPSANSVNSAENSTAASPAPDSDSGTTSEKDAESKSELPPKPEGGGLRVRSSSDLIKSNFSDFDAKDSGDPLLGENSSSFLGMSDENQPPAPVPSSPGLTILSAAQLGATDNSSCDSDNLLQNIDYQNQLPPGYSNYGMPNDAVEYMSIDQLGAGDMCSYKCNLGPECSNMLFMNAADLSAHQNSAHNIGTPVQQLAQQFSGQVQRLQVPQPQPGMPPQAPQYAMRGMPSPQFRQGMPPHSGLLAPKQAMGSPRYPNNAQSRFGGPQGIRPRMQMSPVNGRGQPMGGRGGVAKRPGPPLGRGGAPMPQKRRYDTLMPSRLEDNDCHVIAMQKRNNDAGLVIQNVQGRDSNLFQLSDAITLSLRNQQPKENPTKSVTNVLASRGITVTPSGCGKAAAVSPRRNSPTEAALNSLNLNSAISIISTNTGNNANKQASNSGFAVPKGIVRTNVSERPPRPPTVDLTGNDPPQRLGGRSQYTCQVCDKMFASPDMLNQHMLSHRTGTKLPFKCNLCNAQYPNQQSLVQHKKSHHREAGGTEMALPVVDLKQPGTLTRLQQLGVKFCIPLSQLGNQSGGIFGLPVISIDGAKNPAVCNLSAIGASNILSLGPIKSLGR